MTTANLGDQLNLLIADAKGALFNQAELAQLMYGALDIAVRTMQASEEEEIEIIYPVGWLPDRQPIQSSWKYKKDQLLGRYQFLAFHQLAVNGLFQLVAITEALLADIVRALVIKYPHKLGAKRTITIQNVLEATSIEEIHLRATDTLLNELSYKSPSEFAEALQAVVSIHLLECPAFHQYMEIKASRDIFIHNRGIANDSYIRKAGTRVRVKSGMNLPADIQYFLESYEACLQLNEWLERQLHERWHSNTYEGRQSKQFEIPMASPEAPAV
nr:hypothetical protein [Rhodoferax sp.]